MFNFGLFSSFIPYIVLAVAYLFYLGACFFNTAKEIPFEEDETTISFSASDFSQEATYQNAFDFEDTNIAAVSPANIGLITHQLCKKAPFPNIKKPFVNQLFTPGLFSRPPPCIS